MSDETPTPADPGSTNADSGATPDAGATGDPTPPAPPTPPVETAPPSAPSAQYVRVRQIPSSVTHPEHGRFVTPRPGDRYRTDDPLVIAYPWLFEDQDVPEAEEASDSVRLGPVEQATAAPGERSNTRRPGSTAKKQR